MSAHATEGHTDGDPSTGLRRLNWGCGDDTPSGWINSDLKSAPGINLTCDVRRGLPLADKSCDYVVSIHALPMISYPDLAPVLSELLRVIRPGGVLRLGLPDLERGIAAYQRGDRDYFLVPDSDCASLGGKLIVQLLWYGWSVTLFTADFAMELLSAAGFTDVRRCDYGVSDSGLAGITALDNRPEESFFVEGTAP